MPNNNQNNKLTEFIASKGFYLLLALCLVGAGGAAYLAMGKEVAPPPFPNSQVSPGQELRLPLLEDANKPQPNLPIAPSEQPQPSPKPQQSEPPSSPQSDASGQSTVQANTSGSAYALPIASEVFAKFSNGELVKDETMGDWRTHNGIDISAAEGTIVKASAGGKVRDVRADPLWGCVIEVDHPGNITTIYCGLSKELAVKKGDTVKLGQTLGKVSYIPSEGKLPSHLHFEMKKDGKYINPLSMIK